MPYIGNASANRFVASKAATQFSGDGSTTAFTLDHSVGADEDILVSVDGVVQEPSVAYAVSGTTLTFTAAPSTNSGNNIFVYYLFRTVGTIDHPATSALSATSGTFSTTLNVTGDATFDTSTLKVDSTNNRVGVGTASPASELTVAHASGTDGRGIRLVNSSNSQTYETRIGVQGLENTSYAIKDITQDAVRFLIDLNGHVTMPSQSAFYVKPASNQDNFAVSGDRTIVFGTEVYDVNADFASNTFTAPVTGKYQFNANITLNALDSAAASYYLEINTSNRNHRTIFDPDFGQDNVHWTMSLSVLADMDASDTATVTIYQGGGTAQTDVTTDAHFSGYLVA